MKILSDSKECLFSGEIFCYDFTMNFKLDRKKIAIVVHAFERFFSNFYFYGLFNAEFREDFRHGNNSSVTSKSPFLPKFKNIYFLKFIYSEKAAMILKYALPVNIND